MTTSEVAETLRTSVRSFHRRRSTGRYEIEPVDWGVYARADVWRLHGLGKPDDNLVASPPSGWSQDMTPLRESMIDRRLRKRPRPFPKPSDPARHDAYLSALELWLMPGVAVEPSGDSWAVSYMGRLLPVGAKGAVRLTRETQILICEQVRELRQGRVPQEGRF